MITIYGASGHAKVVRDIIVDQGRSIFSFVDDNEDLLAFENYDISRSESLSNENLVVIAIGNNKIRKAISKKINSKVADALIHSRSFVSPCVMLGNGTVVMPMAMINASTVIGEHCIINSGAIIEHDCLVESFAHISPGCILTGGVVVGEGAHIGAGAVILPGVKLGSWSVIGAGAIVINDVPENVTVVGNPAKILRNKNE